MAKYYTGVGQREIPGQMALNMKMIAENLERKGYILRSGGADGSDSAFESGVKDPKNKEIYLPWKGYNGRYQGIELSDEELDHAYSEICRLNVIPWIHKMKDTSVNIHMRNFYQVAGKNAKHSSFVVYYCDRGSGLNTKGGTRTAVVLAEKLGIQTFNLFDKSVEKRIMTRLVNG